MIAMKLRMAYVCATIIACMGCIAPAWSQEDELKNAEMLMQIHAFDEAIATYQRALQQSPGNVTAFAAIGDAYRRTNRLKEAREWYAKALNTGRANDEVSFQYGLVLKGLGRYEEAKTWFAGYANISARKGNAFKASCDFAKTILQQEAAFTPKKEYINTAGADFGPSFYGDKLLFASARTDIKNSAVVSGNYADETRTQLFVSGYDRKGFLSKPSLLLTGIQSRTKVGPAVYNAQDQTLYFTENNFENGTRWLGYNGLVLSLNSGLLRNNTLEEVTALPFNSGGYSVAFPSLSANGNTLYFAADSPDGYGGFDLYVSYRRAGKWSEPQNLGPAINTPGDEITPFIDGNTLYFSSNWQMGLGGYDIFQATLSDSKWGNVMHLGQGINSSRDDFGFIYDAQQKRGYLVSNRLGGRGDLDIYQAVPTGKALIALPGADQPTPPIANDDNRPQKDQIITLRVLREDNGQPIPMANLDFSECGSGNFATNYKGEHSFTAIASTNCDVTITKDGFQPKTFRLRTNDQDYRTIEVSLTPQSTGYFGFVIDEASALPLANVRIIASDVSTNAQLSGFSNAQGRYELPLQPNRTYDLTFNRSGYQENTLRLNTADASNRNILGRTPLKTVGLNNPTAIEYPTEAYSVQIGTFSASANLAELSDLSIYGNVYRVPVRDGLSRYKVGSYRTKDAAEQIKAAIIAKTGLYKDAIVTKVTDPDIIKGTYVTLFPNLNNDTPPPVPGGGKPTPDIDRVPPGVTFRIQLGVYSNPAYFERTKYDDLGPINTNIIDSNGKELTLFTLGNYPSEAAAQNTLEIVKSRGLQNAFIVKYKGGKPWK